MNTAHSTSEHVRKDTDGVGASPSTPTKVAVYLDLMSTVDSDKKNDSPFTTFITEHGDTFAAWQILRSATKGPLDPTKAGDIAADAAAHLRDFAAKHDGAEVHLMFRGPFPVAVLLGRLLNTLRIVAYELASALNPDTDTNQYVPVFRLSPSHSDGVIREVLLTTP